MTDQHTAEESVPKSTEEATAPVGHDAKGTVKTLLVVDVELSEESGSDVVQREGEEKPAQTEQEVVLLAYMVVQLDTTTEESASSVCTGQLFVKPSSVMPPTPYYTSLTGITKEDLEQGVSLADALDSLHDKVSTYMEAGNTASVCVMSDGGCDVDKWLRKDAAKKNVELRSYLNGTTLDLRKEFSAWKPDVEGDIDMANMLKTIGAEAAGSTHCGETELANILAVVKAMADAKYGFKVPPVAADEPKTQVIRLRGLPYQVTETELLEFLKVSAPDAGSLHICRGSGGRPTGDALVRIPPSKLDLAIKLSGERIGHRYAEVFGTTELEMADAIKRSEDIATEAVTLSNDSLSRRGPLNAVVKLRGMPFTATQEDIQSFFIGVQIDLNDVHVCRRMDGRPNGDAYVQLQTTEELERCLTFDRKNLGSRWIECFRSTQSEMFTALGVGTNMGGAQMGGANNDSLIIRMQGLPFTATESDVMQFFQGLNIAHSGITFRMNRDGRPSGVAYATFMSRSDYDQAMQRHHQAMGSRYVELYAANASEVPRQQGGQGGGGFGGMAQPRQGGFPATYGEYQQQRSNHRMQWEAYHRQAKAYYDQNGYGAQYQQFYDQQLRQFQQSDQQAMQYYSRQGQPGAYGAGGAGGEYGTAMVFMKGLPYSATPIDIADFFNGFNVGVDDVQIVMNNDGRPSGDANVRFPDNASAQSAVGQLQRAKLGSRWVELYTQDQGGRR